MPILLLFLCFTNFFSPDIFILDDPTSSLDNKTTHYIMENIRNDPHWSKKTFVIATNNLKMLNYADKVIHVKKGRIDFYGNPEEFKESEQYQALACEAAKKDEELPLDEIREAPSVSQQSLNFVLGDGDSQNRKRGRRRDRRGSRSSHQRPKKKKESSILRARRRRIKE